MLRHFRYNIIIRILILLLLISGVTVSIFIGNYILAVLVGIIVIISVTNLIQYVNQTNKDLANFLASIKYNDFTTNNSTNLIGEHFEDLHEGFNMINRKFLDIRAEKEANHQFLQTLVQHIDVGLLGVNKDGEIILINNALQKLLRKSYFTNISAIKKIDEQLWQVVTKLESGQRELLKVDIKNNLLQLSIQAVDITLQKEPYRLLSFQDIQNELEAQELVAWQKLIRILTHEIMNSVAPISSLSSTLMGLIGEKNHLDEELLGQIKKSLTVIEKRSEGLLNFTEAYRQLTKIPPPQFKIIDVRNLIETVEILLTPEFEKNEVKLKLKNQEKAVNIKGDPNLLEQVLINLVKNSLDAVKDQTDPTITINLFGMEGGKTCLQVIDNGMGISESKLEQIFIPFYTTKENGSGIGLSLSRQIVRMHKGTLNITSTIGTGTVATIVI